MEDLQTDTISNYDKPKSNEFCQPMDVDDDSMPKSVLDLVEERSNDDSTESNEKTASESLNKILVDSNEGASADSDKDNTSKTNEDNSDETKVTESEVCENENPEDSISNSKSPEPSESEINDVHSEKEAASEKNDTEEDSDDKKEQADKLEEGSKDEVEKEDTDKSEDKQDSNDKDEKEKSEDKQEKDSLDDKKEVEEKSADNVDESKKDDEVKAADTVEDSANDKQEVDKCVEGEQEGPKENENSILKSTLTENVDEDFNGDYEDEDFDPSLLCPEVSMDIEEAPVNTNSDAVPNDGSSSPLPYEAVFSTFVDEMTGAEVCLNLTPEEQMLRNQMYGPHNRVEYTKVHCTACNVHLGSALDSQKNRFIHPMLKVLVCKECYNFYCSGEFEKDEDGSELYCRWCGQGGQVFCCSRCEYVFCKKCIRNNFGRKKLSEVNQSDEWECFRCDSAQLAPLRAHASELFDYVRNEISRAATLNEPSFLTTDHSRCCQKKKAAAAAATSGEPSLEASTSEPPRKRRRNSNTDPDYAPHMDEDDVISAPKPSLPPLLPRPPAQPLQPNNRFNNRGINIPGITVIPPTKKDTTPLKPIIIMPKSASGNTGFPGVVQPPRLSGPNVRPSIGYTTHRPANSQMVRNASPGYIKIVPPGMKGAPQFGGRKPRVQNAMNQGPRLVTPSNSVSRATMRHEWFEKTVRATAKVNSNLSYTLTQLGRAQSQASTVEALAIVHNKLQEILSTSINSLIQIRKSLRTEFIAGIKTIKFPPKEPTITIPDDDVIFVSPPTSSEPPALTPLPVISSTVSLTIANKEAAPAKDTPKTKPPATENGPRPRYLKVKSFSALQSVPSECITIPDEVDEPVKEVTNEKDPLKPDEAAPVETETKAAEKETLKPPEVEKPSASATDDAGKSNKDSSKPPEVATDNAEKSNKGPAKTAKLQVSKKLFEHLPKVEIKKEPVEQQLTNGGEEPPPKLTYTAIEIERPDSNLKHILSARVYVKRSPEVEKCLSASKVCNGD